MERQFFLGVARIALSKPKGHLVGGEILRIQPRGQEQYWPVREILDFQPNRLNVSFRQVDSEDFPTLLHAWHCRRNAKLVVHEHIGTRPQTRLIERRGWNEFPRASTGGNQEERGRYQECLSQ